MESDNNECKYGLKSNKPAPPVKELSAFEEDLVKMAENIQFRQVRDHFLSTLSSDSKVINRSQNIIVFADKTGNLYERKAEQYNKLLHENVTAIYKLTNEQALDQVNK